MMNRPRAIAIDAAGALFVSYDNFETHGSGVWKFTETGVLLTTWTYPMWSEPLLGLATAAAGTLYATQGGFIKKYASDGTFLSQWGAGTAWLHGIAIDAADNVYVSDVTNDRIQKFTSEGTLLAQWGSLGSRDGEFNDPRGVAVDDAGNVYVVDSVNQRVQKFGYIPTPAKPTSWGRLKAIYR
jgi:sugar lactone lactonase YvrE